MRARARARVCVCVCVYVRVRVCACAFWCQCTRNVVAVTQHRKVKNATQPSAPFKFALFVHRGIARHPLRVGSIGDMGWSNLSDATVARLTTLVDEHALDLIVHNGDISYVTTRARPSAHLCGRL